MQFAYGNQKIYVLIPLLFCLVVEAAIMFAAAALYVPVEFPPGLGKLEQGCISTGIHPLTTAYWIVPLIFDAIVVVMTVTKLAMNRNGSRSKIAKVFLRDGLMYFSVIFGINLINTVVSIKTFSFSPINALTVVSFRLNALPVLLKRNQLSRYTREYQGSKLHTCDCTYRYYVSNHHWC